MRTVIIVISFLFLHSCDEKDCPKDSAIDERNIEVKVFRQEEVLFSLRTQDQVMEFLQDRPNLANLFFDAGQYASDTILAEKVFELIRNPHIDTLYREAITTYEDFGPIRENIETIYGKLQTLFPSMKTPEVQTVVTGLYKDLYISDSLIIIGIDYFIGEEATYTPKNIPDYILSRYDKEHLPAIIAKFMAGSMISSGNKETLLSEMIDFGKTYYLASRLLPCTPDSLLLGYTPQEMELITENESIIWANFVQNEILYETSHITKKKFLGERPKVFEINRNCPGRIGAWVGWQIVESYMDKNDVPMKSLLEDTDNEGIFRESGYKPDGR